MLMSFSILCIVLAVLSYINFSYDGLDVIEKNKQKIVIDKEKSVSNENFLKDIESVLNDIEQDIMYRYVDTSGDKPHYKYYKTNHTEDFIGIASTSDDFRVNETESISTCEQKKYKTSELLCHLCSKIYHFITGIRLKPMIYRPAHIILKRKVATNC